MEYLQIALLLGVVAIFGVVVYFTIHTQYRANEKKAQASHSLGFTPLDPGPELVQKITGLYDSIRSKHRPPGADPYELRNVYSKRILEGKMIIFDLLDTSGEDDSTIENAAVAILSPQLALPSFLIFPKSDHEGVLSDAANKVLAWLLTKIGDPIAFPEVPAFQDRYLVSSPDPEATRQYLDAARLRRLSAIRMISIHAGGDLFTLSRLDQATKAITTDIISTRIDLCQEIFNIFTS